MRGADYRADAALVAQSDLLEVRLQPLQTMASDDKRDEGLYAGLVGGVIVREVARHKRILLLELEPEAKAQDQKSEPASKLTYLNSRPKAHQENTRIDGMPHVLVRTGLDELMSLLEGDLAAPIARQRPP